MSSGYCDLKLINKSYLTTFSCLFDRYQYIRLLFGEVPVGDMFEKKVDKLFNNIPNVFGISNDILIAGFDEEGSDHDKMLKKVLQICRQSNLKLNKDKCLFRFMGIPFMVR